MGLCGLSRRQYFHLRIQNEDVKLEETMTGQLVVSLVKDIIANKEEMVKELEQSQGKPVSQLKKT